MPQQDRTVAGAAYLFELGASMAHLGKSALLSLSVLAGVAFAAQAQTSGLASLPPNPAAAPPAAASPVAPSVAMPGPNPGTSSNAGMGATQASALVTGFHGAFVAGVIIAAIGIVAALTLIRRDELEQIPEAEPALDLAA